MDTDSLSKVMAFCESHGYAYEGTEQYWQAADRWEIRITTPNGYICPLEKEGRD